VHKYIIKNAYILTDDAKQDNNYNEEIIITLKTSTTHLYSLYRLLAYSPVKEWEYNSFDISDSGSSVYTRKHVTHYRYSYYRRVAINGIIVVLLCYSWSHA